MLLWLVFFIILICFFIMLSPLRVEVDFHHGKMKDQGTITFLGFWNLVRFRIKIPEIKWKGFDQGVEIETVSTIQESETTITKDKIKRYRALSKKFIDRIDHFFRILRKFLRNITCEKFHWETLVGTGNAAETGTLIGVMWGTNMTLLSLLGKGIKWKEPPVVQIYPAYAESAFEIKLHSIICFRIGHAILAITRLLLQFITNRRE